MPFSSLDSLSLDEATKKNIQMWLSAATDGETKKTIQGLIEHYPQELIDAFYTTLSFGTGGLRGIMGVGSNRMNRYTVGTATQGLANYLNRIKSPQTTPSVCISYDSRIHSREFAEETAQVLAANGIRVYIFEEMRPIALLSFACRFKKSDAGIMITASHNPPEYNGYKVYWNDGAQVLPPHDKNIIEEVKKITDLTMVKNTLLTNRLIEWMGKEVDETYFKEVAPLALYKEQDRTHGAELKIIYSNLHGTGITVIPEMLKRWGFSHVQVVAKQKPADGHFPTVKNPNPEEPQAMKLGIEMLLETGSDLFLATDPDADRVGVAVLHKREVVMLTGNQMACICLDAICQALTTQKRLPPHPAFVKTIVTTELFKAIADSYKIPTFDVLTGFKYIAEKIKEWEQNPQGPQFIFGGEESYGYLFGTHVRDKDAVISCALICEIALNAKQQGKTLVDQLHEIYKKYGIWREKLLSVEFEESRSGKEQMKAAMHALREHPFTKILGTAVISVEDYLKRIHTDLSTKETTPLTLPQSDVLAYHLADGTKLIIRPSGTEPKVKLYCSTSSHTFSNLEEGIEHCDVLADEYLQTLRLLLKKK